MRLYTPNGLLYPVKVTRLLRQPGDDIEENAPLFDYEYKSKVLEGHINSKGHLEDKLVERTWPATFESELEGSLTSLNLTVGQVLTGKTLIADIEETCKHEVQFGGLCANCGKDMKEVKSYNSTVKGTDRATINTVHDRHGMHTVLVSQDETVRADEEAKRRLLDQRKLTLVVDLDQTVIQCCVEETVGEWKNDPSNPNFEALKNVVSFRLPHDSKTYYLKFRPGLTDFLEEMSKYYEMHVYTMASRDYAQIVTNLIDPERKIFGTRVLSRDENGPEMRKALKRLFPVDTSMVVIIDDRGDVWQWSPNLIKVNAYDFFVGVGDINSSFLPKRQELEAKPKQPIQIEVEKAPDGVQVDTAPADGQEPLGTDKAARKPSAPLTPPLTPPAANGEVSAVDLMVSMAGGQDDNSMEEKKHEHDETLASQLADRPLLKKQKILDAADEEAKEGKDSPAVEEATEILREDGEKKEATPQDHPKYRHNLLQDDDTELEHLGNNLRNVHDAFFAEFEKGVSAGDIGRVAELRPGKSKKQNVQDLQNLPDAAVIMQAIKSRVLGGVHLVFSGVVPLGVNVHTHDTVIWAKTFGATVTENITKKTTHVIASPERRTAKVRQAAKKGGRIAIVSSGWLFACFSQWQKVDENPFRIHSDAPLNGAAGLPGFEDKEAGTLSSSDEEAALTETEAENETDGEAVNGSQPTLEIDTDVEEELAKYAPHDGRADSSPTEEQQSEDWDALQAELNEFLGSEAEDSDAPEESDNESDRSAPSSNNSTPGNHKRKRDAEADDAPTSNPEGSRLQKRKKEAMSRTTSLNNMSSAGNLDGTVAVDEPAAADDLGSIDEEDGEDVDLEAALAAELEKDDDDGGEAEGES